MGRARAMIIVQNPSDVNINSWHSNKYGLIIADQAARLQRIVPDRHVLIMHGVSPVVSCSVIDCLR